MKHLHARLAGVELYFDDLKRARKFYSETLGLKIRDEQPRRYSQFDTGASSLCLERKHAESYPSRDRAVVFLQVEDLAAAVRKIGSGQFVHIESRGKRDQLSWAVLHDPEGHNILFLQAGKKRKIH